MNKDLINFVNNLNEFHILENIDIDFEFNIKLKEKI